MALVVIVIMGWINLIAKEVREVEGKTVETVSNKKKNENSE